MKTVFCKCRQCKACRKRAFSQAIIKRAQRHVRQQRRIRLARGDYDSLPVVAAAGWLA